MGVSVNGCDRQRLSGFDIFFWKKNTRAIHVCTSSVLTGMGNELVFLSECTSVCHTVVQQK